MKITESQLELLRSLKCERLSSKPENFSLIDDFYNTRYQGAPACLYSNEKKECVMNL